MYALIDISNQMLEDSAFDMEGKIRRETTKQFAVKEGAEIRGTVRTSRRDPLGLESKKGGTSIGMSQSNIFFVVYR